MITSGCGPRPSRGGGPRLGRPPPEGVHVDYPPFAVEYLLLGAGAGLCGTGLAAALAWAVLRFALDVRWAWAPATLALGVAAAVARAVAVGFLGTMRLLGQKPLGVLRGE